MAGQGVLRALRASVFALVCVLLGAAGHALSSGALPPLLGLVTGVPLVVLLTMHLTATERSLSVVTMAVLGAQLGLHALFDYAAAIPGAVGPHAEHLAAGHADHAVWSMTPSMAAAHMLAGVVAGWWLRRGEARLWAHCAAVAAAARPLLAVLAPAEPFVLPAAVPLVIRSASEPAPHDEETLRHSVVRRGPPRVLLAR